MYFYYLLFFGVQFCMKHIRQTYLQSDFYWFLFQKYSSMTLQVFIFFPSWLMKNNFGTFLSYFIRHKSASVFETRNLFLIHPSLVIRAGSYRLHVQNLRHWRVYNCVLFVLLPPPQNHTTTLPRPPLLKDVLSIWLTPELSDPMLAAGPVRSTWWKSCESSECCGRSGPSTEPRGWRWACTSHHVSRTHTHTQTPKRERLTVQLLCLPAARGPVRVRGHPHHRQHCHRHHAAAVHVRLHRSTALQGRERRVSSARSSAVR